MSSPSPAAPHQLLEQGLAALKRRDHPRAAALLAEAAAVLPDAHRTALRDAQYPADLSYPDPDRTRLHAAGGQRDAAMARPRIFDDSMEHEARNADPAALTKIFASINACE